MGVFVLGASVGSFVNVLIDRSIERRDWVWGRSKCDHCGSNLEWYDLIPLLSYFLYLGKSRCCQKKLSWKYPVVEALLGALFVWWLLVGFLFFRLAIAPLTFVQPIFWLVTGILLLIIAIADSYYGVILMNVLYLGYIWVYGYRLILYGMGIYRGQDLVLMLVMGLLSGGFLWGLRVITKGRGMGEGDPYLAFWTGSILGYPRGIYGMLAAFIVGAIWGTILLLNKKKSWGATIPFGPFLVLGVAIALLVSRYG